MGAERGGIGSVDFALEEIERAGAVLARVAGRLAEAEHQLAGEWWERAGSLLALPGNPALLPVEAQRQQALAMAALCRAELGLVSMAVGHSRQVYEAAEASVQRAVNDARALVLPYLLARDLATNGLRPRTATTEELINRSPVIVGELAGFLFPWLRPVASQAWMLQDRAHGGLFDTTVAERLYPALARTGEGLQWVRVGPVEVVAAEPAVEEPFDGSLGALLGLQARAEAGVAGPGSLLVTTVRTDAGPVHVVTFPGTQAEEGTGTGGAGMNPWDAGGVAEALGLGSQHVAAATLEALEAVGARPGEALVLAGYSQGGVHAANVAVDPRVLAAYRVEHVVTTGSPVGNVPLPETVRGLHLEHVDDPVPGADGIPNPDTRNQVTVYLDGYAPGSARNAGAFGAAHRLENYAYLSAGTAGTAGPAAAEGHAALAAVFAGAASARVATVSLRRAGPGKQDRAETAAPVRR
ncbi:hypothetical protein NCCP1664_23250 [Zafaria cholistanensis]|uniref:Uncharacterized protein n=1 Tax=Zafaria cholistanensis TaxID=1682741 RepID=A0A5A7NSS3_9MICC|nr:hypothetical protein [Zafaria cholistanensis]GER23830.1 hypothetical protein NCCP1664_23250 [Zafaria cholistanensis]